MSLLCRLKNLVHKGMLKEKDLERIIIIPEGATVGDTIKAVFPNVETKVVGYKMTNSEIIEGLKALRTIHNGNYAPCVDEAIKRLSVEPCEDYIRRQAVLDKKFLAYSWCGKEIEAVAVEDIESLSPVKIKPKSKTGRWEHGKELSREYMGQMIVNISYLDWHCSNCHCIIKQSTKPEWNYCPTCGADMTESEERYDN